jgi:hypothetical protein
VTTRAAHRPARRLAALVPLALVALAGCTWTPQTFRRVPLDASTGFYQSARLSYRLDAGKLQQPLDVIHVESQRVSYDQVASSPMAEQSIGTLTITYPHPNGREGFAQARFALDSIATGAAAVKPSKSWNPFKKTSTAAQPPTAVTSWQPEVHEAWVLDLPRGESDSYFKLLSSLGYYNTDRPSAVGVQINAEINGKTLQKSWDQVAELNALVQRVRRDGQLVAYSRPSLYAGASRDVIASTQAYSEVLAQGHAQAPGAVAAASTTSAFAMPSRPQMPETVARAASSVVR